MSGVAEAESAEDPDFTAVVEEEPDQNEVDLTELHRLFGRWITPIQQNKPDNDVLRAQAAVLGCDFFGNSGSFCR